MKLWVQRQFGNEAGSWPRHVLQPQSPPVRFQYLAADVEPEAQAAEVPAGLAVLEKVEQVYPLRLRDPRPVVAYSNPRAIAAALDADLQRCAGRVFDRISYQVADHLYYASPVEWRDDRLGCGEADCDVRAREVVAALLEGRAHNGNEVAALGLHVQPAEPGAGYVQQLADELRQAHDLPVGRFQSSSTRSGPTPLSSRRRQAAICSRSAASGVFNSCEATDRNSSRARTAWRSVS